MNEPDSTYVVSGSLRFCAVVEFLVAFLPPTGGYVHVLEDASLWTVTPRPVVLPR